MTQPAPQIFSFTPLEQYQGEIVPYEETQQDKPSDKAQKQATVNFVPIDQYKGEVVKLTQTDVLKMAGQDTFKSDTMMTDTSKDQRRQLMTDVQTKWSAQEKKGLLSDLLKAFVKAPLTGLGKVADMLTTDLYNFVADTSQETSHDQRTASQYLPYTVKAEEVKSTLKPEGFERTDLSFAKGSETLTHQVTDGMTEGDYTHPSLEVFGSGMEFLGQLAGPGGIAKLATKHGWQGLSKVAGFLGSVDPKVLAGGFAFGATDKVLEHEVDDLSRLGLDTTAALGTQALVGISANIKRNPGKTLETLKDLPYKAAKVGLGITKKNFNKDIADAFVKLGLEAPVSTVTDSRLVAHANKVIGKLPFLGESISQKHQALESQFTNKLKDIGEQIGPVKDEAISQAIEASFHKMTQTAGTNNMMDISHSMGVAEGIVYQLKKAAHHDDPSKATLSLLGDIISKYKGGHATVDQGVKEFLSGSLYQNMPSLQKQSTLKALGVMTSEGTATVDAMIEQYRQLNGKMSDKNLFSADNGKRTLNMLHKFRQALNEDFARYGKDHPQFEQARTEANKLFTQVKNRERWDKFWNSYNNHVDGTKRYKSLTEALHDKRVKAELSKVIGEDRVGNLEMLTKASKGMARSVANDPNPSSTEAFRQATGIMTGFVSGLINPLKLVGTIGVLSGTSWALGNKNFVRKLVEFSQRPTPSKAEILEKILKKNTGLGLVALSREFDQAKESQRQDDE